MRKIIFLFLAGLVFFLLSAAENKVLNEKFRIKNKAVYYMNKKAGTLDAETFEILNEHYAGDKNGIYFYNNSGIETEYPVIKTSGSTLSKSDYILYKEYIFYKGSFYMNERLIGESHGNKFNFDRKSLKIIGIQPVEGEVPCGGEDWSGSCRVIHRDLLFTDKDGVYITIEHIDIWKFRGIDPETFEKTGDGEYKDKNGKYTMDDLWKTAGIIRKN